MEQDPNRLRWQTNLKDTEILSVKFDYYFLPTSHHRNHIDWKQNEEDYRRFSFQYDKISSIKLNTFIHSIP